MKYTRKKGGKYLGQGSFGCGFINKPLKCINETHRRNSSYITKVMVSEEEADNEIEEGLLWKAIDPEQEFSIYAEKKCYLDTENIKPENEFEKCTVKISKNSPKTLIISKFGGTDLYKLKPISTNYSKIFKAFIPLIRGLNKVHNNYLTHNDIKEQNIVAEVKKSSIVLRFIDFGFSYPTKNMVEMSAYFLNEHSYYYWPFEIGCFDTTGNLHPFHYVKERYEYLRQNYQTLQPSIYPVKYLALPNIDIKELYQEYKSINFSDFHKTFKRLDIYSMGITLAKVLFFYFRIFIVEEDDTPHIVCYTNKVKYYRDFINEIKDNLQKEWNINVFNKIILPLLKLIIQMISIYPNERPTLENVIKELEALIPHINEYLTTDQVRYGLQGFNILNKDLENALDLEPPPSVPPAPPSSPISPKYKKIYSSKN